MLANEEDDGFDVTVCLQNEIFWKGLTNTLPSVAVRAVGARAPIFADPGFSRSRKKPKIPYPAPSPVIGLSKKSAPHSFVSLRGCIRIGENVAGKEAEEESKTE